jgi:hypothetical protein
VAYPAYIRDKARQLRIEKRLSIVEISERLALPKTTIYYWVRDLPLGRPRRENPRKATLAMQAKFRRLREAAYEEGRTAFATLAADPTFRDFVCMYVGEGSKRDRNVVAIGNSDPQVVLTVRASDTLLRARLQAWMDEVQRQWLDSPASGA